MCVEHLLYSVGLGMQTGTKGNVEAVPCHGDHKIPLLPLQAWRPDGVSSYE